MNEQRKSILIVDDESDIRLLLKAILTRPGYSFTEACDGQEALDLLTERKFDLMILDLMMPRMTGEELLERLGEKRLKEMPTIVLTAKTDPNVADKVYRKGVLYYLLKPFSNTSLRELVRYLIEDLTEAQKNQILADLME